MTPARAPLRPPSQIAVRRRDRVGGLIHEYAQTRTPRGAPEALIVGGEFAHLHPHSDGSLHLTLPRDLAEEVVAKGWGEPHVVVGWATLMVYGPRDPAELKVVWSIVRPRTTPRRRRASRCRS